MQSQLGRTAGRIVWGLYARQTMLTLVASEASLVGEAIVGEAASSAHWLLLLLIRRHAVGASRNAVLRAVGCGCRLLNLGHAGGHCMRRAGRRAGVLGVPPRVRVVGHLGWRGRRVLAARWTGDLRYDALLRWRPSAKAIAKVRKGGEAARR